MRYLLAFVAMILPASVSAQQVPCAPLAEVVAALNGQHGESPIYQGLAPSGFLMQLWSNPDTGTWTVIYVLPSGDACLAALGEDGERLEPVKGQGA